MSPEDKSQADAIVVIPARGGSKGLPHKNVLPVGGVPLITRAVRAAQSARLVRRVIISTDDDEIAEIASNAGAEIVRRPAEISGDTASSESAIFHALDFLMQEEGLEPAVVGFVQCTSPFVTPQDIDGTLEHVLSGEADSAFAAAPSHLFIWSHDREGVVRGVNHHGGERKRRQDLEPEYIEAGSIYAMNVRAFRAAGHRFCGRQAIHVIDASRLSEIDDPSDLELARALAPLLDCQDALEKLPKAISCVVFDFDGVFTDNGVYVDQNGTETVRCDRGDGMGIAALRERSVPMLVLSKEQNPVVATRCAKLTLECLQGQDDKRPVVERWLAEKGLDPRGLVYVGNDVNDADCLGFAACAVGPGDSHHAIAPLLALRLTAPGGRGSVRELCDLICRGLDTGVISLATPTAAAPQSGGAGSVRLNRLEAAAGRS